MIAYNPKTRRFEQDGLAVSMETVLELIAKLVETSRKRARALSVKLAAGQISIDAWSQGVAELIRSSHIVAASVGRGGVDRLSPRNWKHIERKVGWQLGYLEKFRKRIAKGEIAPERIASRTASYFAATHTSFTDAYQEAQLEGKEKSGIQARLIQNSKEGCAECTADAAEGWMPVEEMTEIGGRECGDFCLCFIEFSDGELDVPDVTGAAMRVVFGDG